MELEALTEAVLKAAFKVQSELGPGLLESSYRRCLAQELRTQGFSVREEVPVPISYHGLEIPEAYRIDLLVNDGVVVELKTVEHLTKAHEAQVVTYLRFSHHPVGLLLNFWAWPLKDGGIKRVIFTHPTPP